MTLELFSRVYALLGDRTSNPDGDVWDHDRLWRLVTDLGVLIDGCRAAGIAAKESTA